MLNKKKNSTRTTVKISKRKKKKENVQRIDIRRNDGLYEQTKDKKKKKKKDRLNQMTAVHSLKHTHT
jgi:hypothetical protein